MILAFLAILFVADASAEPMKERHLQTCDTLGGPPPPISSTCWQASNAYDRTFTQTGCDFPSCQDVVCACDSYCCEKEWDLSCRGYIFQQEDETRNNYFVEECSASLLCCEDLVLSTEFDDSDPQTQLLFNNTQAPTSDMEPEQLPIAGGIQKQEESGAQILCSFYAIAVSFAIAVFVV